MIVGGEQMVDSVKLCALLEKETKLEMFMLRLVEVALYESPALKVKYGKRDWESMLHSVHFIRENLIKIGTEWLSKKVDELLFLVLRRKESPVLYLMLEEVISIAKSVMYDVQSWIRKFEMKM